MGECGKFAAFIVVFGIVSLLSWLSKKKKEEEEARARQDSRRRGREPAPEPQESAATDLEGFLEQLAGKTKEEPQAAPPAEPVRREERRPERPRQSEARAEPEEVGAEEPARLVKRLGPEDGEGPSPFERRREEMERRIAAAKKEAEEMGLSGLSAEEKLPVAAAARPEAERQAEMLGLPAAALVGGELNRESLRQAIVMMEVLGRPRALRGHDMPY